MQKIKFLKLLALVFVALGLVFTTSCKKDDKKDPTPQESLIELLNGKTFTATSASTFEGGTGVTVADVTASFTGGATMNFTLTGGDIQTNSADGGSFAIAEDATLSGLTVNGVEGVDATAGAATYSKDAGTLTITFTTAKAAARTTGIGSFTLVFEVGKI